MIVMSCIVIDDFAIASRYTYLICDLSRDFYLPIYCNFFAEQVLGSH